MLTDGMSFTPGTPCWIDLSTPDPPGSRDFYAGLLGWTYRIDPEPASGHYTYAMLGDSPVAGLAGTPAETGQPITWTLYLTSANCAHTAGAVVQLGGQVLYGPVEIQDQGSMLVGVDPTGATIGFWQPSPSWLFCSQEFGTLCWAELNTWDGVTADNFYALLFGYRQQQIGDGATFDYTTWTLGEQTRVGRLLMGPEFPPETTSHWIPYFAVDPDVGTDTATGRARELGGRISVDPFDSSMGRISVVEDPFGAQFSLVDASRRLEFGLVSAVDDPYDD